MKNRLSAYLKKVRAGETVLVADRDRPIARIERVGGSAGALQLAAAGVAADGDPAGLTFVCLDERLNAAAQREGFAVLP